MNLGSYVEFLNGVIRNPKNFSTLFPTGNVLSNELVDRSDIKRRSSVLELGAGSGAISKYLIENLNSNSRFTGLEIDAPLVEWLSEKYPEHRFRAGSAANLSQIFPGEKFDLIIASLPWTLFELKVQTEIVAEIDKALTSSGLFLFFITKHVDQSKSSHNLKDIMQKQGFEIQQVASIWLNLPPANIYLARKGHKNDSIN